MPSTSPLPTSWRTAPQHPWISSLERGAKSAPAAGPGAPIEKPIKIFGGKATLHVYYSRSPDRNGINCVWLDNNTGKPAKMSVELRDTTNPGPKTRKKDIGTFGQYAGSVRVGDMRDHCMQVIATFEGGGVAE